MFYSSIDQHKATSVITTLTATGEQVAQVTLPNHRHVLRDYFQRFPGPHQAVVEATGRWYWLRDLLIPAGVELQRAHAKLLKAIAYAKVETDAVDSVTLAQLLRVGLIPPAHMISDAHRGPRDVLRTRLQLVERRLRCELTRGSLLDKFNVAQVAELPPCINSRRSCTRRRPSCSGRRSVSWSTRSRATCSTPPPSNACSGSPASAGSWPLPSFSKSTTSAASRA